MLRVVFLLIGVVSMMAAVDMKRANLQELATLNGIGEAKAKNMIAFRKRHYFKIVDKLVLVNGIDMKTVEKNKRELLVSVCK